MLYFMQGRKKVTEITGVSFDEICNGWSNNFKVTLKYEGEGATLASYINYDSSHKPSVYLADFLKVRLKVNGKNNGDILSFKEWKRKGFEFAGVKDARIKLEMIFFIGEDKPLPTQANSLTGSFDFEFGVMENQVSN